MNTRCRFDSTSYNHCPKCKEGVFGGTQYCVGFHSRQRPRQATGCMILGPVADEGISLFGKLRMLMLARVRGRSTNGHQPSHLPRALKGQQSKSYVRSPLRVAEIGSDIGVQSRVYSSVTIYPLVQSPCWTGNEEVRGQVSNLSLSDIQD